jgi:hypothetical protein
MLRLLRWPWKLSVGFAARYEQWDSEIATGAKGRLIGVGVVLVHAVKMQVELFLSRANQDLFSRYGDPHSFRLAATTSRNCQDMFYLFPGPQAFASICHATAHHWIDKIM